MDRDNTSAAALREPFVGAYLREPVDRASTRSIAWCWIGRHEFTRGATTFPLCCRCGKAKP